MSPVTNCWYQRKCGAVGVSHWLVLTHSTCVYHYPQGVRDPATGRPRAGRTSFPPGTKTSTVVARRLEEGAGRRRDAPPVPPCACPRTVRVTSLDASTPTCAVVPEVGARQRWHAVVGVCRSILLLSALSFGRRRRVRWRTQWRRRRRARRCDLIIN